MHPDYTPRDIERLDQRTDFNGPVPPHRPELGNCWPYIGQPSQQYPEFKRWYTTGDRIDAHVAAYEIRAGPIPEGLCVLHKCDFGRCTRPSHLFLGTAADNMQDMNAKGRGRFPGPTSPFRGPRPEQYVKRGERHPMHILVATQVRDIRLRFAAGDSDTVSMASEYGVSEAGISAIIYRHTWAHTDTDIPKPQLGPTRGERQGRHILTEEQVRAIKRRWQAGQAGANRNYAALANQLGVKTGTISAVHDGRTWKHITP